MDGDGMTAVTTRYRVTGMDCPSCVAKIEKAARSAPGVVDVRVSIASGEMALSADGAGRLEGAERAVAALGYRLDRLPTPEDRGGGGGEVPDPSHAAPGYRRALWAVVLLNVGYGVAEMAGGLVSGSQALKADALDFLGDGMITLLGLVAIGWGLAWRARSALAQGVFLGALGVGVLASTAYRVLVTQVPEAGTMGAVALGAMLVNVLAALVLVPHRAGDANARAVWLFSRNDALGNLAVAAAAGLVAWTGTPWPDLAVAAVVAALFLQSSWSIVRAALADMAEARRARRPARGSL